MNNMGLLTVNTLPIPSGQASVNRILSLGKGLVENGENVTILSAAKSVDTNFHDINGIKYVNFAHSNNRLIGYIQSLFSILRFVGRNKKTIDAIWLVSNSPLLIWPLWYACKLNGIKYLLEKSEFPFVLMKKGFLAKLWAALYVNTIYKLFDGMIIMTQPLFDS